MPMSHALMTERPQTLQDRLLLHAAWVLAAAVFLTVGWTAMRSWDPRGPVSLLTHSQPLTMMIEVLALVAVTSAVATVLAGRRYPDVGAFAVGIALTLVSIRGDNMTYLLIEGHGGPMLCVKLIAEGVFWCAAMAVAMCVAAFVVRWIAPREQVSDAGASPQDQPAADTLARMAAPALPILGRFLLIESGSDRCSETRHTRLKHIAVAVLIALVITNVLSAGAVDRAIRHGQACFAVWVGFYFAVKRAQASFPVRSTLWSWCAVPVVCVTAYGFAWVMSIDPAPGHLPSVPASSFLRVLPVTYIALGTSAVLVARWRFIPVDSDGAHA